MKNGLEKLKLMNKFDEEVENADEIIAEVMRQLSELNPNADKMANRQPVSDDEK